MHNQIKNNGKVYYIIEKIEIDNADLLKQLSFELRKMTQQTIIGLGAKVQGKPMLSIIFSEDLTPNEEWNAVQMIKKIAPLIQGGGGGQPFYATAGGKNLTGLDEALNQLKQMF
jgi:alanyl-tRNA synthetase